MFTMLVKMLYLYYLSIFYYRHSSSSSGTSTIIKSNENKQPTNDPPLEKSNKIEETNESTKNLSQKVDSQNDENVQLGSTHLQINEVLSEFNALMAKYENELKMYQHRESAKYFIQRQERIQQRMTNPSANENEKFLTYVDGFLQELKRFLVIRRISVVEYQ